MFVDTKWVKHNSKDSQYNIMAKHKAKIGEQNINNGPQNNIHKIETRTSLKTGVRREKYPAAIVASFVLFLLIHE